SSVQTCSSIMTALIIEWSHPDRDLHSFPTRRSSDLDWPRNACNVRERFAAKHCSSAGIHEMQGAGGGAVQKVLDEREAHTACPLDRKSTRLNSSHVKISYAVICLTKKNAGRQFRQIR